MNRRGFIGSLAALVGVVVAKVNGAPTVAAEPPLTATGAMIAEANKAPYVFGFDPANKFEGWTRYVYVHSNDGLYKWEPTNAQKAFAERYLKIDTE
jgi:hypothetical protein